MLRWADCNQKWLQNGDFGMKIITRLAVGLVLASGTAAHAAEIGQDAIDACIDQLRMQNATQGGTVLSTEYSEANSLVMLQDGGGAVWQCLVSNDGRWAELERQGGSASAGTGMGSAGGPASWRISVNGSLNIHSAPSTSAQVVARLPNGMVVENRGCQSAEGRIWCEVADGDASGWAAQEFLIAADGENSATADDAGGAMSGAGSSAGEPGTQTEVVRFPAGSMGTDLSDSLTPGSSKRYVLGASNGQMLYVAFSNSDAAIDYQIILPDGSFLLDLVPNSQGYSGQLFETGDHVIEVVNRGSSTASYVMSVTIN
jgi:uncharacterized protein YraI